MNIKLLKSKCNKNFSKGFTILEILVVVSVIAILIGVAIPRFKGMRDESNIVKAKSEVKTLMMALESYKRHSNSATYPVKTAAFFTLQQDYLINASPKLLDKILYDPFGATATTEYGYMTSANGAYYVIWSVKPGSSAPTSVDANGTVFY